MFILLEDGNGILERLSYTALMKERVEGGYRTTRANWSCRLAQGARRCLDIHPINEFVTLNPIKAEESTKLHYSIDPFTCMGLYIDPETCWKLWGKYWKNDEGYAHASCFKKPGC